MLYKYVALSNGINNVSNVLIIVIEKSKVDWEYSIVQFEESVHTFHLSHRFKYI